MSWGCFDIMRCKKCGYEYRVENDTISSGVFIRSSCPMCKGEVKKISSNSMLTEMNKQKDLFKNRKKRVNL